ncbi:MAG TPA: Tn3 family transposase [Buttiauxella sp.]|jgi:hypothetical protein
MVRQHHKKNSMLPVSALMRRSQRKGIPINEQLVVHLSPLGWEHINLSGDYVWRNNLKLGSGKYRPLRTVDTELYKKQS